MAASGLTVSHETMTSGAARRNSSPRSSLDQDKVSAYTPGGSSSEEEDAERADEAEGDAAAAEAEKGTMEDTGGRPSAPSHINTLPSQPLIVSSRVRFCGCISRVACACACEEELTDSKVRVQILDHLLVTVGANESGGTGTMEHHSCKKKKDRSRQQSKQMKTVSEGTSLLGTVALVRCARNRHVNPIPTPSSSTRLPANWCGCCRMKSHIKKPAGHKDN